MRNNLCPYSVATGMENYYLLAPSFKFIKKDKIDYDTILDGIYVPDPDLPFEELELCTNHSNYDYYNFIIYKWKRKKINLIFVKMQHFIIIKI